MHREILRLAIPSILANIVVPLLGLIDLTIAGHLGATAYIGAISVGATMFNLTYWNFGFLRMGTSGMTAQQFGRGDMAEAFRILLRASVLAVVIGAAIMLLQYPLRELLLSAISPGNDVRSFAVGYFDICVWGAPALLSTLAISGWFIGMQNSVYPMIVSISVNVINIAVSLSCVYLFEMGFNGIAVGTLTAQWCGLAISIALAMRIKRNFGIRLSAIAGSGLMHGLKPFFSINSDIFLRSLCLMLVTLFFTAAGARSGDLTLAVNALIMQLFVLYSYFMDGFAFAGEALSGRYLGARDLRKFKSTVKRLFFWGLVVILLFSVAYGGFCEEIMSLITDDSAVLRESEHYRMWALLIPAAGAAAFIWDGVYIGLTATRQMLSALAVATAAFFAVYYGIEPFPQFIGDNNRLWLAFIVYLASRGALQFLLTPSIVRRKFVA